jgi:oligopeptide/dipeptide ABC transporter ATP-binding protein
MTLRVRDLTVGYGDLVAVDRVDLDIGDGEVLALVGESGCGKTSLARSLLGLLPATAKVTGSARLGDLELAGREDWNGLRGRRIGIVPQGAMSGLSPVHRVGAQLDEMILLHGGTAEPTQLLERVGLGQTVLKSFPHQLSGGQRQRVAIALTLAGDPELIVADEPTTGLDAITQGQVLELITSVGVSTLIVSHDLTGLLPYAHRVAVMYAGRMAEVAKAEALSATSRHPYTAGLLTATPSADRAVSWGSIPGAAPPIDRLPPGCRFAPRCPLAIDVCLEKDPPLLDVGPASVACHRHAEADRPTYPLVPRSQGDLGEPVVRATGIRHVYRSRSRTVEALKGVDLEVQAGEIVGLVGESGSGKSTLARILLGLIRPTEGRVELSGRDLTRSRGRALRELQRRVGFVHQDPYDSLHPGMRVGAIVAEPLAVGGCPREDRPRRVLEALASAGLSEEVLDRFPGQLSGGQRQRVSIARALVCDPVLLMADEATSMLDVSTRGGIATTLRAVATERGLAVVFVTHDVGEAVQSCDRIVVLQAGTVVEQGASGELCRAPSHPYTAELLGASHH